jgi:long-subunit fatty acid transport protein
MKTNKNFLLTGFIFISFLLLPDYSFTQNINDALRVSIPGLGSSARALGMGNSYVALSDDASAFFFNPAGLGLLKRMEFSGGLDYINFNNDATFFNIKNDYSNSTTKLNNISFAFPFPTQRGSLVFGLGYQSTHDFTGALKFNAFNSGNNSKIQDLLVTDVPYDLYLTDEQNNTIINGMLNQSGDILNSGSLNSWTFSGAIEVAKNVFVGANLNILSGVYKATNNYYEDDTKNIYQDTTAAGEPQTIDFKTFNLNTVLDWDIEGWNAKVGILYQFKNFARFGGSIQFPKVIRIKEKFFVDGLSEFGTGQSYNLDPDKYSDEVEYDIITPFEFTAGFSFNFRGLIVSAEGTLIDYTQMEFENYNGLTEQYVADINKEIKDNLAPTFNYNFGAEYTIPDLGIRIRGGYFTQPSAYKADSYDFDRKFVTGGLGFLADETLSLDLAYIYGWWKNIGDNYGVNVSRTFQDIKYKRFTFSVNYRF